MSWTILLLIALVLCVGYFIGKEVRRGTRKMVPPEPQSHVHVINRDHPVFDQDSDPAA